MKKILLTAFLLLFGISFQTQAVAEDSSQGSKTGQTNNVPAQGNQSGNAVETNEQNKVMNQGEETQIQTQEQNTVETGSGKDKTDKTGKGAANSSQRRSQVANAVQSMNQIADRNGGIGQQIRTIAQNQNQNQEKLEKNIEKIQGRSKLAKFFIGPNYGEIKDAKKTLEQNREQIRELNQIRTQLMNQGDQDQLMQQIKILEQNNQEIETLLEESQKGFSLFGWFNKLIS